MSTFCLEQWMDTFDPTMWGPIREVQRLFRKHIIEKVPGGEQLARGPFGVDGIVPREQERQGRADSTIRERILFVDRTSKTVTIPRQIPALDKFFAHFEQNKASIFSGNKTGEPFPDLERIVFSPKAHTWEKTQLTLANSTVMIGVTGAGFFNQFWLPRESILILLDCTRCLKNQRCTIAKPHRPHDKWAGYLGHHVLHYMVDADTYDNGYPLADMVFFWNSVTKFVKQIKQNFAVYEEDAAHWAGMTGGANGKRKHFGGKDTLQVGQSLLCDTNESTRKMRCRLFGGKPRWKAVGVGDENYAEG